MTESIMNLLIEVRDELRLLNGAVKRHEEEIFGNHNEEGILMELRELHDFRIKVETSVKVIMWLLGLIGVSNLVLLFSVVGG